MRRKLDEITIVGGGDSGLLAGLAIQKLNPDVDVSIVDDFESEPPQVGKSTFFQFFGILHDVLEIDQERFTREVRPIWKASIYFRDWCGAPPFHYPFDNPSKFPHPSTPNAAEILHYIYEEGYRRPLTLSEEIVAQGKSPWYFDPRQGGYDLYTPIAYHLDLRRFNTFLRTLCRERGIALIDDEITEADISDGRIERIRSERQSYEADLYVDATGFNRLLKAEQGGEFREFDFPLDSAYTASYERPLSEVVPATVVESGDSGWFWEIDTFDERGNGYVYASEFASDDEALAEFLDHCPDAVTEDDVGKYEFDSGYYRHPWTENCLVIGNAGGFVEPLQATALTVNADSAVKFSMMLSACGQLVDDGVRETYNAFWQREWEATYDFIAIHYKYAPGETAFWEATNDMAVSDRVERVVSQFDRTGFDTHSFEPTHHGADVEPLTIFSPGGFYTVLRSLGVTSECYESMDVRPSDAVTRSLEEAHERRATRVERDHITTEEFYKGVTQRH